jgi:hypothetical protein
MLRQTMSYFTIFHHISNSLHKTISMQTNVITPITFFLQTAYEITTKVRHPKHAIV